MSDNPTYNGNFSGRQTSRFIHFDISYAQFIAAASGQVKLKVPVGSEVISGNVNKRTAFNSSTSDSLKIGDASDDDRYLTANDLQAVARASALVTGYRHTNTNYEIIATWTGVGTAPTAGSVSISLELLCINGPYEYQHG